MSCKHLVWTCVALLGVLPLMRCAFVTLFCGDDPSLTNNVTVPIYQAVTLITNRCYNSSRRTVTYTYGFNGKNNGTATVNMLQALISLKRFNVMLMDWQLEASAVTVSSTTDPTTIQISYVVSGLEEAFSVGTQFGYALVQMAKAGLDLLNTYLVGFSLGAQVMAIASRVVIASGMIIFRLLGLEPAGPLWGTAPTKLPSINSADAQEVFCVHTDPGHYGINDSLCKVDLYANYLPFTQSNTAAQVQPGCPKGNFETYTAEGLCSHNRVWMLFVEALLNLNHNSLTASKASNISDWEAGRRNCSDIITLGIDWDTTRSGVYYMDTNSASPYGMGTAGYCP